MKKIFFLFILLIPIFANATSDIIFQKNLWYGFKIVQTKNDISISYKQKEIFTESNSMGGYYGWPSSMWDFENIRNASPANQQEQKLIDYAKTLNFDNFNANIEKITKEYSDVYDILVRRLRLTACYADRKAQCSKITIKSPYWYGILIQNGYTSGFRYINKITGTIIEEISEVATKSGKSWLYVLSHNEFVDNDPYTLYLLTNDGSRILQFQTSVTDSSISSFELLPNKKIHLYWEKIDQVISVKL